MGFQSEGFVADTAHPLFAGLSQAFRTATLREPVLAPLTCTTDARTFHLYYGIPATCLGPLAQRIHGIDEVCSKENCFVFCQTDVVVFFCLSQVRIARFY